MHLFKTERKDSYSTSVESISTAHICYRLLICQCWCLTVITFTRFTTEAHSLIIIYWVCWYLVGSQNIEKINNLVTAMMKYDGKAGSCSNWTLGNVDIKKQQWFRTLWWHETKSMHLYIIVLSTTSNYKYQVLSWGSLRGKLCIDRYIVLSVGCLMEYFPNLSRTNLP